MKLKILLMMCMILISLSFVSAQLETSLDAYWNFDDGLDLASGKYNLTNFNGAAYTNNNQFIGSVGNVSNSTSNNGAYFNVTNSNNDLEFNPGNVWSISGWFYKNSTNIQNQIMNKHEDGVGNDGFFLFINQSNHLVFSNDTGTNNLGSSNSVIDNEWQMFSLAKNSSHLCIFLNGEIERCSDEEFPQPSNAGIKIGDDDAFALTGNVDEIGIWTKALNQSEIKDLYLGGNGMTFNGSTFVTGRNLVVSLDSPLDDTTFDTSTITFNATLFPDLINLTNATLKIWFSNGSLWDESTNIVTGSSSNSTNWTISNIPVDNFVWNVLGVGLNGTQVVNKYSMLNFSFIQGYEEIQANFDSNTIETKTESFSQVVNISSNGVLSDVNLWYEGVNKGGTSALLSGNQYNLSTSFDIPTGVGTNEFFWQLVFNNGVSFNLTTQSQTVSQALLSFCNATNTVEYVSFTFKNETLNQEDVNATIASSSWTYWLGSGSVNKTFSYSNSTENSQYDFCFSPSDETIIIDLDMNYDNAESQQRTFLYDNEILTNTTTNQVLYLLPTSQGLFSQFNTVDNQGDALGDVKAVITRDLGGSTITSSSGYTDDSGFITFFLNPDVSYTAEFSKPGFQTQTFSFTPSTDTRTVVMGSGTTGVDEGTSIGLNTTLTIFPSNSSLNNNTDYTFSFSVDSSNTITFMSMNITNSSGGQVYFDSQNTQGILSTILNTGTNQSFIGTFIYSTANETITVKKLWTIGDEFIGDYSIFRQLKLYLDYGFDNFIQYLIVMSIVVVMLIFMSHNQTLDNSESKVAVVVLLIWAFSIVGWLDTGLVVNSANSNVNTLTQYSSQYGIAILTTAAGIFFIGRRIFI